MKKYLKVGLLVTISCFIFGCISKQSPQDKWQELKTADFAGLLENAYDFIETPYFDSICVRLNDTIILKKYDFINIIDFVDTSNFKLSFVYESQVIEEHPDISLRHYDRYSFCLKSKDSILLRDSFIEFEQIQDQCKEYIFNPANNESLSEKRNVKIDLLGKVLVSKGRFTLSYHKDNGMSIKEWKLYFSIIDEFYNAYYELRNEFSILQWGKSYDELDFKQKIAVIRLYPTAIILNFVWSCGNPPIPPPPPPADIHEILNIVNEE